MNRPQIRGYRTPYKPLEISDIGNIIEQIPTLTKIGGICLVTGKFAGVLAIPAIFIPASVCAAVVTLAPKPVQAGEYKMAPLEVEELKIVKANPYWIEFHGWISAEGFTLERSNLRALKAGA